MSACVYVITHLPSGKEYVGSASYGVAARWAAHISSSKGQNAKAPLGSLIVRDGPDAFSAVEVAQFETIEAARIAEVETMRSRKSFWPAGLNVTPDAQSLYRKHLGEERRRAFVMTAQHTRTQSLHNTTLGDLSDEDNVRQFEHELRGATTAGAALALTQKWGDSVLDRLRETAGEDFDASENLKDAEAKCVRLETKIAEVSGAAEALIKVLDNDENHSEILDAAIAGLENAL